MLPESCHSSVMGIQFEMNVLMSWLIPLMLHQCHFSHEYKLTWLPHNLFRITYHTSRSANQITQLIRLCSLNIFVFFWKKRPVSRNAETHNTKWNMSFLDFSLNFPGRALRGTFFCHPFLLTALSKHWLSSWGNQICRKLLFFWGFSFYVCVMFLAQRWTIVAKTLLQRNAWHGPWFSTQPKRTQLPCSQQ